MINNANLFQIRVGSSTSKEGGQVYNIKQIIVHPKYTHKNIDYDLSLFELKKPLTMGPNVKALTLPPQGKNSPNGAQLLLTGFGKISDTESTNTLMGQYVNIFGRKACNKYFKKMKVEEITETMLCINGLKNNGLLLVRVVL